MGVAIQNGDILSARVWMSLGPQACVNSYNYQAFSVSGGGLTDQDFANAFDLLVSAIYKSWMAVAANYHGVQVYYLARAGTLPAPVKTISSAGPGASPNPTVPTVSRAVLSYNTFLRGPGGRGRVYLPFLSGLNVAVDGSTTPSFDTAVNSLASVLLSPIVLSSSGNSATMVWSLVKRHPKPAPPTAVQILAAEGSQKFGQQHKGGSYGRPNISPI
jgi:hypothetical protein